MSAIKNKVGYLKNDARAEFELRDKAMSGDIVMTVTPATCGQAARATTWTRTVLITFKTAAGEVHDWLTQTFATKLAIADTSALGTASIASTSMVIVNGVATVVISGTAAAWLNTETDTLTVTTVTVLGTAVAVPNTSVQTWTA